MGPYTFSWHCIWQWGSKTISSFSSYCNSETHLVNGIKSQVFPHSPVGRGFWYCRSDILEETLYTGGMLNYQENSCACCHVLWGTMKQMCFVQVSLFMLLSAVCVILSLAGSMLSCQNAQMVKSYLKCQVSRLPFPFSSSSFFLSSPLTPLTVCALQVMDSLCVCCEYTKEETCTIDDRSLLLYPHDDCNSVRHQLKVSPFILHVCQMGASQLVWKGRSI